jgi:ribonuclease P/MRP protein subunit RPP40
MEKKLVTLLLFVDFKKAKLLNYGLHNSAIKLLRNYLHDRKQFVQLNGCMSEMLIIIFGVPQGSVLGPLLFLIFINDMPYSTRNFINILFADDTTLCQSNTNLDDLIMVFKRDLVQFFDWCAHNRMDVNWSKTFIMIIKSPRMKISIPSEITIESTTISTVNNFKLLGVELSSNLDFSNFVSKICMQVNRKLYSIKRLLTSVKLQFFCLP